MRQTSHEKKRQVTSKRNEIFIFTKMGDKIPQKVLLVQQTYNTQLG